ncbi:hypothetical protein ACP70R_016606 [Stipagrostis hirtigluma subsp. patula]
MEGATSRYYCHMCSLIIRPEVGLEEVKCPHCHTGFVEEMAAGQRGGTAATRDRTAAEVNTDAAATEREVSLWAPVLMDFLAASSGRQGLDGGGGGGDLAAFARRQYRNIALLQLLNALQESDAADAGRERVMLVSPADAHAMLMQGRGRGDAAAALGAGGLTLGDLFLGPGLDLLLEYLAETDPSRQGTPPARKDAVAALPTVRVPEAATCPVCLDELTAGGEAREMPCKHRFHDQCIFPWLEMHSSCPVCRYQLPTEEAAEPSVTGAADGPSGNARDGGDGGSGGRRHWFSWPFAGLFSNRSNGSSSSSSS